MLILELLPILDDFERALASLPVELDEQIGLKA
jgi:molecular chaperone GrpE (heat shock protein)